MVILFAILGVFLVLVIAFWMIGVRVLPNDKIIVKKLVEMFNHNQAI